MTDNKEFGNWLDALNLSQPLVIAGPCSAETEEQVLKIAHQLKQTRTSVMRAGVWKPRSRPGSFEGAGEPGLQWLKKAKEETGLLTTTEVANASHVELALKYDVDILWVGARSTVSPFIVQEIAEAVRGVDTIVLVKNPVNPDLPLWLGALERFYAMGVKNLGAIHRGFSTYEKTRYRNNPEWQIAIDLQNTFPSMPLILDPSHIAGRRDIIFDLCQTAMDLNYDGLMIETHNDPENAWSDAAQQITPASLIQILNDLRVPQQEGDKEEFIHQLNTLRTQIDVIDDQVMEILGNRMKIVDKVGVLKKENNVSILQVKRWNAVLERMIGEGKNNKLSEEFVMTLYKAIHQESIRHQEEVINEDFFK